MSQINFDDEQYAINEPERYRLPKKPGIFRSCACFFVLLLIVLGVVLATIAAIVMPYKEKTDKISQTWSNFIHMDFGVKAQQLLSGLFSKSTSQLMIDVSKEVASSTWQKMASSSSDVIKNISSTTKANLSSSTDQLINQATSSAWEWLKNSSVDVINSLKDKLIKK